MMVYLWGVNSGGVFDLLCTRTQWGLVIFVCLSKMGCVSMDIIWNVIANWPNVYIMTPVEGIGHKYFVRN